LQWIQGNLESIYRLWENKLFVMIVRRRYRTSTTTYM